MQAVHMNKSSLATFLLATLVTLQLAPIVVNTARGNEIIYCTITSNYFMEPECTFTFQCPTDCLCILSERIMTVDCPIGQFIHDIVVYYSNQSYFVDGDGYDGYYFNISVISWYNTGLTNIAQDAFKGLVDVTEIYLGHNRIVEIHPGTFDGLINLWFIDLDHNRIVEIHLGTFDGLNNLRDLDLGHNRIVEIHPGTFDGLVYLGDLDLGYNRIVEIQPETFGELGNLQSLILYHNNLISLSLPFTVDFSKLSYMSLSYNKLSVIQYGAFQHMKNLRYLDLYENRLDRFDSLPYLNNSTSQIEILDLRKNHLYSVNGDSFVGLNKNTSVLVDSGATCCFIQTANCNGTIPRSQFLTCGRLLSNLFQRIIMWILGIFSLTANIGALYFKYQNRQENTVQVVLISNLSVSDMIMGIYMIIVASADLYYKDYFPSELWRHSVTCKIAGTLSILSSEASVLFVTLISLDRFMGIRYTFSTYRLGPKSCLVLAGILWVIATVLSVTSTIISGIKPDLYDVSEVCTGLPLSRRNVYEKRSKQYILDIWNPKTRGAGVTINTTYDVVIKDAPGMYYGIAVFTVLNSICFLTVFLCYAGLFITVIKTSKRAGRARNIQEERKMAAKMGVIVMTDLACWAPVIFLSILVQSGGHIVTPHVYTWIVTLVLPINSAINPFLYTLANIIFDFISDGCNRVHPLHI